MTVQYNVTGAVAVAVVGGASRYLYHGARLPEGVENLEHLLDVGLVGKVEAEQASEPASGSLDHLTLAQLRLYAAANGIELGGATKKAEVLETIQTAEATPVNPATPLEDLTIPQLQAYADEHGIDTGEATEKADLVLAIETAQAEPASPTQG